MRVDIPRKDPLAPDGNGHANGLQSSGKATPDLDDEEEEPTIPITLTGPQPLVLEAQALLNQIIASKTSRATQRVRDIPLHVLPFIAARRANFIAAAEGTDINLTLNNLEREITASGDREAVLRVVEAIKATVEGFKTNLMSVKTSLPKHQHRLLMGKSVDEILSKAKCSVVVAKAEDPSDEVVIWGQGGDLAVGFNAVMEKVHSQHVHALNLPGPCSVDKQLLTYLSRIGYAKTLGAAHPGVSVHMPRARIVDAAQPASIDLVGEKAAVDAAVQQLSDLLSKLIGATREVEIDWLLHRFVTGKNTKR